MAQPNQFCQIPPQNVPFLNPDGTVATPWYKFLHDLHIISGADTPGHGLTRWNANIGGDVQNAQIGYRPHDPGLGIQPALFVFNEVTGAGSVTNVKYPVGFILITPLP